ncbi:MAG: putative toxin-antitoxin system toxin component, PIN family [Cyanobacteria bacterium J06598_3]
MRIVLDTNILVAAARSQRGAAYAIIEQLPSTRFEIALTVPLYVEYQAVLTRPDVMTKQYTEDDALGFAQYLCSIAHQQDIYFLWRPWLKDPKDDMVLEAALASQSQYIVTHNLKDFINKDIENNFGIYPVSPQNFLKIIS